jgi:hypothetical protein
MHLTLGNILMMSTSWMKKGMKCVHLHKKKKGVDLSSLLFLKSSSLFSLIFHNFNDHNSPS